MCKIDHPISISIVMPVYNCEDYLKEQIDSLLSQSFDNFELIIINDGSTDLSAQIIFDFMQSDSRIKLLNNEFSKGIAGALNMGLKYATGKYIARCDGDDIDLPNRIETQFKFLEANEDIDIVGGSALAFNNNGYIREFKYPQLSIELCWRFISNTYFCHPSVMFRTSLYHELGGYPDVKAEDFAYFSKILKYHKGYNLPIRLLDYRVHEKNYSNTNLDSIGEYVVLKYRENYQYYISDSRLVDEFYFFQTQGIIPPKFFFKLWSINCLILNKIRINYKMKIYNTEFLLTSANHFFRIVNAVYKYLKANIFSYIRNKLRL